MTKRGAPKRVPKERKPAQVPIQGKAAHNTAFLVSIGNLVLNSANNESVFLAMLQTLIVGGHLSAAIVWHGHRTTRARLELVSRLCRERITDKALLSDIDRAISRFNSLSGVRNFYCHGTYRYDTQLNLHSVSGVTTPQDGAPLAFQ